MHARSICNPLGGSVPSEDRDLSSAIAADEEPSLAGKAINEASGVDAIVVADSILAEVASILPGRLEKAGVIRITRGRRLACACRNFISWSFSAFSTSPVLLDWLGSDDCAIFCGEEVAEDCLLDDAEELRLVLKLGCEALLSNDGERLARIGSWNELGEEEEEGDGPLSDDCEGCEGASKRLSVEKLLM